MYNGEGLLEGEADLESSKKSSIFSWRLPWRTHFVLGFAIFTFSSIRIFQTIITRLPPPVCLLVSQLGIDNIIIIIVSPYESTSGQKPPPTFSTHLGQMPVCSRLLHQNFPSHLSI